MFLASVKTDSSGNVDLGWLTSGELVPVKDAKVSEAQGQLPVGARAGAEDEAVPRAVHGLQPELSLLHVQQEHVLLQTGSTGWGLDRSRAAGIKHTCFGTL